MKTIPIMKCKNIAESLAFYIDILGFELQDARSTPADPVINLLQGSAEIQLSILGGDSVFGCAVNIMTDEVDDLFKKFVGRGLDTSGKPESPVHQGPLDQTWGLREFYVDDPNGNTLRFAKRIDT